MHAVAAIQHVTYAPSTAADPTGNASQSASGLNSPHHSDLVQSSGLLRAVAEAHVATASPSLASAEATSHAWPVECLVSTATTLISLTSSPASRIQALSLPCIVGIVDSIRTSLDQACLNKGAHLNYAGISDRMSPSLLPAVAGNNMSPKLQSPDPPSGVPQHAAVISCMAVLIQVLQCYPLSQELRCRRCDVISYALAAGLVYRIAHFFLLMHGTVGIAAAVPASVRQCMRLLELLTAADPRAVLSAARGFRDQGDGLLSLRVKVSSIRTLYTVEWSNCMYICV